MPSFLRPWLFVVVLLLAGCGSGSGAGSSSTCDSNSDCSGVEVCRQGTCAAVSSACDTSADCGTGSACIGGACRKPCKEPSECGEGLLCAPSGFCVQCTSDDECAPGKYCGEGICRTDACVARSSSCKSETSVSVCSDRGDTEVTFECSGDSTCVGVEGEKWCSGWVCKPNQARCAIEGNVAEVCSGDGAKLSEIACGDEAICVEGECAPIVCKPGEKLCKDGSSYTCNRLGTDSKLNDYCSAGEYCNPDTGLCAIAICEPNEPGCYGNQTGVCNDLGSAYEKLKACKSSEACVDGDCKKLVCTPYATSCKDGDVYRCNVTGTGTELDQGCNDATEYCQQSGDYAYCSYDVCVGSAPVCNGNVLTTCKADGSGYEAGGTACGSGKVCVGAECKDTVCSNSSLFCENDDVRLCNSTGTGSSLYSDCSNTQYCNSATNGCSARICTPGAKSCSGNVTRTCNALGSGYETGTDCATVAGTACDSGECKPVVCAPSSYSCDGQTLNQCNAMGTGIGYTYACPANQHCFQYDSTYAYCRYDVCTAGAPLCDGNVTSTCAADGSGPGAPGTDCALSGDACYGGVCKDVVCTGTMACNNGDFQYCINNGTAFSLADDCTASEYCNPASGCKPHVCTPGTPMCSGEFEATCAVDGSGPTAIGTDCAASGQLCQNGSCKPIVCEGDWSCQGDVLHHCQQRGTFDEIVDTCGGEKYCSAERKQCLHEICTPGETVCVDSYGFRTCNATGTGYDDLGTACASGELCEAGACTTPESACSIATATWSAPVTVHPNYLREYYSIGVDEQDNLFVFGADPIPSPNLFALRYDAAAGAWDQRVDIDQPTARGSTDYPVSLAVSGDGSALVAYLDASHQNYIARYDVAAKTWEAPTAFGAKWASLRIAADASGRFLRTVFDQSNYNLLGSVYVPGIGWGASKRADTAAFVTGRQILGQSTILTPRGQAAVGWHQYGGGYSSWWSRTDLDNFAWTSAEKLSDTSDWSELAPFLSYTSPDGSEALLLYSTSDGIRSRVSSRRWSSSTGLGAKVNVGSFRNEGKPFQLLHAPNGDAFFVTGTGVFRLAAGASSWVATNGSVPNVYAQYVVFANGELLAVSTSFVVYRYSGGSWTSSSLPTPNVGGVSLLKLAGCRAALFNNSSSGLILRYLE